MRKSKHKPEFQIPLLEKVKEEIVVDLANHIGDQEKHFNSLETQYRILASTWLLAGLGAIGYALQKDKIVLLDKWIIIGLIGAIGELGILLLWLLDMKVYHRLLQSAFLQGVFLEQQYKWLPRIRTGMLINQKGGDVTRNTSLYYTWSSCLLLAISIPAFVLYAGSIEWKILISVIGAGILIYQVNLMINAYNTPIYCGWQKHLGKKKDRDTIFLK